jgi:CRP-like cAMP-binding protein
MSQHDVSFLHHEPTKQSFQACQVIFQEGEGGDVMYGVVEGEVEIVIAGQVVEVVKPGGILGEMALIDNSPRSATAIARSDCKLAVINQKRFVTLIQQTPFFALQVMGILADRLRRWGPPVQGK